MAGHTGGGGRALGVGVGLGPNLSPVAVGPGRRRRVAFRLTDDSRLGRGRAFAVGQRFEGRGVHLGPGWDPGVTLELAHVGRVLDAESVGGSVVQLNLKSVEIRGLTIDPILGCIFGG